MYDRIRRRYNKIGDPRRGQGGSVMTLQKQILIVDDDPVNRAALRTILTPEYRVL